MRRIVFSLTALALGAPFADARAQDIFVRDFGSSEISYANGSTPKIRRGMTSRVRIVKDLIDLVPFQMVSASGGATISSLSNGRTSNGTGFLAMDVTVPSGQATNSTITLNVGLSDHFNLTVKHRGLVSSITANPQPSTLQQGTPFVATVQGTDLGDPVADLGSGQTCHSVTVGNRTNTSVQFTLTRLASCSLNSFSLSVDPSANDDPPKYLLASGAVPILNFSYIPPPPVGVTCTSNPNLGLPTIRAPGNAQVIVFGSGTPSPTNITIRWDSLTNLTQPAPNNEWIVTRGGSQVGGGLLIGGGGTKGNFVTVTGLSKTLSFTIPGTHTISVRPKNCGQNAQTATITFSTRY
jgi:hypothetical protein